MTPATIIPRDEHGISRRNISPNALKVLYRLIEAGHEAYLVGGAVRDLLLGGRPKDFDVATSAHPETVNDLFRNARLIGRRFRLVHVVFGREIIEVATFRAGADGGNDPGTGTGDAQGSNTGDRASRHDGQRQSTTGMLLRDNVYGTLEDDVWRRDFTINALYYTPRDFTIHDHTGGVADLRARRLRMIGEPEVRFREDPVRMLRAVRFAGKLGFEIERDTGAPIPRLGHLLELTPAARLFDEACKLFLSGYGASVLDPLLKYELFERLFPYTIDHLNPSALELIRRALESTDRRIAEERSVTPAFMFAALLWPVYRAERRLEPRSDPGQRLISAQHLRTAIPRRFWSFILETWQLQDKLEAPRPARVRQLYTHPRFRAAYDFLCLRAAAGDVDEEMAIWWTEFQEVEPLEQEQMTAGLSESDAAPDDGGPITGAGSEADSPRRRTRRRPRRRKASE